MTREPTRRNKGQDSDGVNHSSWNITTKISSKMQQNNAVNRSAVLALLRRCFRSVKRIPDATRRESYRIYVKDAFHRRSNMLVNSREALMSYRDGIEQVESMEYYHDQKNNQRIISKSAFPTWQPIVSQSATKSIPSFESEVSKWLLLYLPNLSEEDLSKYSKHLVDDGFDTVKMIEQELLADDILFMKKAHRRVIERQLKDWNP